MPATLAVCGARTRVLRRLSAAHRLRLLGILTPHRHLQPAPVQPRRRLGAIPLHRLRPKRRLPQEDQDAHRDRLHPAHAAARAPVRISPYPLLRLPRQSQPPAEARRGRRALGAPPPAEHADPLATDYRDRHQALTGRSLRQCPPVPRREHATRRPSPTPGCARPFWIRRDKHLDARQAPTCCSESLRPVDVRLRPLTKGCAWSGCAHDLPWCEPPEVLYSP